MVLRLFCDNLSALQMIVNYIFHAQTKHIKLNYHFVRKSVVMSIFVTCYISCSRQPTHILSNPLSRVIWRALFQANIILTLEYVKKSIKTKEKRQVNN